LRQRGDRAHALVLDVTDGDAVTHRLAAHGPFDILVNNAGTNRPGPFLDATESDVDLLLALNLKAAFFVARAVARGLAGAGKAGSIIHVSSQMGHVGAANRTIYCATKHTLEGLAKAMAVELGPLGIRVNTVCPTFIETPMTRAWLHTPAFRDQVLGKIPLGRIGSVEDVMGAVVFLASDAAALVTGSALMVDGGWTAS
jgi:NAD(P)-dependent dehydrogenase (short-subunit alcohol dehydrogenase family)